VEGGVNWDWVSEVVRECDLAGRGKVMLGVGAGLGVEDAASMFLAKPETLDLTRIMGGALAASEKGTGSEGAYETEDAPEWREEKVVNDMLSRRIERGLIVGEEFAVKERNLATDPGEGEEEDEAEDIMGVGFCAEDDGLTATRGLPPTCDPLGEDGSSRDGGR
jgi:hypothetical protein